MDEHLVLHGIAERLRHEIAEGVLRKVRPNLRTHMRGQLMRVTLPAGTPRETQSTGEDHAERERSVQL